MRRAALFCVVLMGAVVIGLAEEGAAAQGEAEKWAAEEAQDAAHLGQSDLAISAVGRMQLTDREWTADDLRRISMINAGVFHATKLLRKQGWVDRSAALQVRIANAGVLEWLRKNPSVKTVQAQGRLRVDGKYFLLEDCRPADEKPLIAPPAGRSKRSGL